MVCHSVCRAPFSVQVLSIEALPQAPRDAAGYIICDDELHPCMENRFHDIEKRLQFCVTSCCNLNDRLHALERQHTELRNQVSLLSFSARFDASPDFLAMH